MRAFFERLGLIFFASACLPEQIRTEWLKLIDRLAQRPVAIVSAWGTTETGPLATALNFDAREINNIGVPVLGTQIKLAPTNGRYELRVRGPNVSPGYFDHPDLTKDAFDDEGSFRTGDLGRLANTEASEQGILIEGRMSEDFKLATGVW